MIERQEQWYDVMLSVAWTMGDVTVDEYLTLRRPSQQPVLSAKDLNAEFDALIENLKGD